MPHTGYRLDNQVGFHLRRAQQRHLAFFAEAMDELALTAPQFAALVRLREEGPVSQNQLGRLIAMDQSTTQGVLTRLQQRGLVASMPDPVDRRRYILSLSETGRSLVSKAVLRGRKATEHTLQALNETERETLLTLLKKIAD